MNSSMNIEENDMELDSYRSAYRSFVGQAKTARKVFTFLTKRFADFLPVTSLRDAKPGTKMLFSWHGKALCVLVIGSRPIDDGLNIISAHIDSPHLDLKPHPIFERDAYAYFDTHAYGYVKRYQWVATPLVLVGKVFRSDGSLADVSIGEKSGEPMFMISDFAPHFGQDQGVRKLVDGYSSEDMDVIIGRLRKEDVLHWFNKRFSIDEEDFLSSELELVPASLPVEIGLRKNLLSAYGHDDRACVFSAMSALEEISRVKAVPLRSCAVFFCDKEEVGSVGATGLDSSFVENVLSELLEGNWCNIRNVLRRSRVVIADTYPAFDPHYPELSSDGNKLELGEGPCLIRYAGGVTKGGVSEARGEYTAQIRRLLNRSNVPWQYGEVGASDKGSCGTEAYCFAKYGADVIDLGVPVLNMHAPHEVLSYADVYGLFKVLFDFLQGGCDQP